MKDENIFRIDIDTQQFSFSTIHSQESTAYEGKPRLVSIGG